MIPAEGQRDLVVLVADLDMKAMIDAALKRTPALGIREVSHFVAQHLYRDSGVLQGAHDFLQSQSRNYLHALTVCDRQGCGREDLSREQLETMIEGRLSNHWADRAAAVVIDPELENWVWADSPHVARAIGWPDGMPALRTWLLNEGFLAEGQAKPADPKAALLKALRSTRQRQSSALYQAVASTVSLRRCGDPAFLKLRAKLQSWFPAG